MGNKIKESERIEKAIRGLLKLPENRRCVNCNCLGPQYVCTTFWTFVCTNCSGIHREFTHRVKSVSMAKFTAEEVSNLEAGGNERAREIYFKAWDPQRNAYPDGSNLYKLRDFIKSVYVDRKYTGANNDSSPRLRPTQSDTEDSCKSKKVSERYWDRNELPSHGRAVSVGRSDDKSFKYFYEERRSPRYGRETSRSGGLRKNPIRIEVVDDRYRDGGGARRYDGRNRERSLDLPNDRNRSSSTVVDPVGDLSEDNATNLQVGDGPKFEERKDADDPAKNKAESSCDQHSSEKSTAGQKNANPGSLIDLLTDSEPSQDLAAPKTGQMPLPSDEANQLSNEVPSTEKAPHATDPNSVEALLFGLSLPEAGSGVNSQEPKSNNDAFITSTAAPDISPNNQLVVVSMAPNTQGPSGASGASEPAQGILPGVGSEPQTNSSGRQELPEDLFTGSYSFGSPQVRGWQSGLCHGMGYGMQYYPNMMTMGTYPYSAQPANPFDLGVETNPMQAQQFPPMASMQGALPHVSAPRGLSHSSSPVAHSSGLMAPQSSLYGAAMAPRSPSSGVAPGAYAMQQAHMNVPSARAQGNDGNFFGSPNSMHQASGGYSAPGHLNSFSSRGNPFG